MKMAHQSQLEKRKYRNWVKAGLGLKYTKEGLEPFCDRLVKQQHVDVLSKVKQKHNLTAVSCGHCDIKTLQPDHVRKRTRQCPLGQVNCNCQHPGGKMVCPNNVCGAIYDEIIQLHASRSPYWRNTDAKYWFTEPWSVAKCFINAAGYDMKFKASEFDCPGFIQLLINNMDFRDHLKCTTDGSNLLQKVLQYRNLLYHSHDMELEDKDVTTYIDDMIAVLQDGKELINMPQSKSAVDKLQELKHDDFVITTTNEEKIRRAIMVDVKNLTEETEKQKHEIEKTGIEVTAQVASIGTKQKTDMETKGKEIDAQVASKEFEVIENITKEATKIKAEVKQKQKECIDELVEKQTKLNSELEQKGNEVGAQVASKEFEVMENITKEATKIKTELKQKQKEGIDELVEKQTKLNSELEQKGNEVGAQVASEGFEVMENITKEATKIKTELKQKQKEGIDELVEKQTKLNSELEQKGNEVGAQVASEGFEVMENITKEATKIKTELKQKQKEGIDELVEKQTKEKSELEQKGNEVGAHVASKGFEAMENITKEATKIKTELKQKQKEGIDELMEKQTQLNIELEQKVKGYPTKEHDPDYNSKKAEYQKKLVQDYMQYTMQVSALPLQPESNHTGIENVYVSPCMTVDIWDEHSRQTKEVEISVDRIFHNEDKPVRNIYILGEAGSGKTAFCKMLVYYWCVAHTEREARESESSAVKVMENYDFLFYVSLRHHSDHNKIENMLDEIYPDYILRTILQNESEKCFILLDGLDEWTPQKKWTSQYLTPGLPARDLHARYTFITTTRRWKFDTLRIKDSEIDKKIKLKGIRGTSVEELTKTTLKTLNKTFHKNKVADKFLPTLKKSPVADVSHVPMILQQLICLWFDDRLGGTSKCAIYSSMLDLFFDWNALKLLKKQKVLVPMEREFLSRLPEYLNEYQACLDNTNAVYHLSHLAYKTLFDRHKENTLTFSNSNFQQLNIPGDVITFSLKVGILSEDQNKNLFASRRQHTSFAFVHKSLQEFLAAVFVAIQFEKMVQSLDDVQKGRDVWLEYCKQFVRDHFGDCKTVADILEHSNIFIMLCGVESQLLPFISEYIYTITTADEQITEERKNTKDDFFGHKHVLQIQKCIVSCVSEALSSGNQFKNSVYIADIVLDGKKDVHVVSYLHRQIFNLHRVLSVAIDLSYSSSNQDIENVMSVLEIVTECDSLKTVKYGNNTISSTLSEADDTCTERIEQQTAEIIARNKSTLETVSFITASERMVKDLVQIIPTMCHLISFLVSRATVSHEVCGSLCTVLVQSVHLQHIYLDITCNKHDEHSINLTKHKQLQYLDLQCGSIHASSVNTESLDTCKLNVRSSLGVYESLYNARRLKHLILYGDDTTRYNVSVARTVTDCLVRLLPSLTSLSTLSLLCCSFTDNIITRPFHMRNLQEVDLSDVTMSMATWCAFVDSLPALPQTVCVRTWRMEIEDIRSPLFHSFYIFYKRYTQALEVAEGEVPAEVEPARQYIREKPESFRVTEDYEVWFVFVTKEVGLRI